LQFARGRCSRLRALAAPRSLAALRALPAPRALAAPRGQGNEG
jgi:hypothetical protein